MNQITALILLIIYIYVYIFHDYSSLIPSSLLYYFWLLFGRSNIEEIDRDICISNVLLTVNQI